MPQPIDLRSDTVTKPTQEMRDAMCRAEVGDDYYFEDPTVRKLEEMAAEKLGKEDALLVASGTMGNLISIFASVRPGDVIIVESNAHIFRAERGHLAVVSGVQAKSVDGQRGVMSPEAVEDAVGVFPESTAFPRVSLICVENTHNAAGGTCWSSAQMHAIREVANSHHLKIHVDGARIFNSAVAQKVEPKLLVEDADSVQFCLTKGLSCPYGSLVVGRKEFIKEARFARQMVGGGMRQAGIMAAAGIVALERMIDRLEEDHENARLLAEGLQARGFKIDMEAVQTNMVFVNGAPSGTTMQEWAGALQKRGYLMNTPSKTGRMRMVTHYGVLRADIIAFLETTSEILRGRTPVPLVQGR
jgi:threonine aldolase